MTTTRGLGVDAGAAAAAAMRAAGIAVRAAASPADLQRVREIIDGVFRPAPGESEASLDLLVALAHTGQYVALADDVNGEQPSLAASLGFFCAPDRWTLHSHVTAVAQAGRGRQIGWALKLHQRAWAMERGLRSITWTFDPLIRRNAWFNLAKLGALPTGYEVDFYGAVPDAVNAGDETDRFVVAWALHEARVISACAGVSLALPAAAMLGDGAVPLLRSAAGDIPVRQDLPPGAASALVQVPADIESLRVTDPALALLWRRGLRSALAEAGERGLAVVGVGAGGWYVLGSTPQESSTGQEAR